MTQYKKLKAPQLCKLPNGMHSDGCGLYLRVRDSSRSWIYRYKKDGKLKDIGLGPLSVISLAKARDMASEYRQALYDGEDPQVRRDNLRAEKAPAPSCPTFNSVVDPCILNLRDVRQWKTDAQEIRWRRTLKKYASERIGDIPLDAITTEDIIDVLKPIWEDKTETAANLQRYIACVFSYAQATGIFVGANPAAWRSNLEHFLPSPSKVHLVEHHAAMEQKDLPILIADLDSRMSIVAKAIIFGTLTAARANEFVLAEWKEIDFDNAVWSCPRRKDGKPEPHRVPLATETIDMLKKLPRLNQYLFPGLRGHGHISLESPIKMLRLLMKEKSVTMHGMRSTFRDWAQEHGFDRVLAEKALMHATGNVVEQAYQRSDLLEQRRPLMEAWARFCYSLK